MTDDWKHPDSGRAYREGDPAHHFAQLARGLRRQCVDFIHHYDARLAGRDFLSQHLTWPSDPDRIARSMGRTIENLDKAYTDVTLNRSSWEWGLGEKDDEWQRKYGEITPAPKPFIPIPKRPTPDMELTPAEWCRAYGVQIFDPDGWREEGAPAWDEPITLVEFERRAVESTTDAANANWKGIASDARICAADLHRQGTS